MQFDITINRADNGFIVTIGSRLYVATSLLSAMEYVNDYIRERCDDKETKSVRPEGASKGVPNEGCYHHCRLCVDCVYYPPVSRLLKPQAC